MALAEATKSPTYNSPLSTLHHSALLELALPKFSHSLPINQHRSSRPPFLCQAATAPLGLKLLLVRSFWRRCRRREFKSFQI